MGISVWILPENCDGNVSIKPLLIEMAKQQICSVLVEGGREVFTSFLKSCEVDRIYFLVASKLFGKGISVFGDLGVKSPGDAVLLKDIRWKKIGMDIVVEGKL
jgi:diaminohydroxyphosphoribosylaminopyrimidine deaminase/5-amino-6-(5-phosphoribosylamino)uracil reductase